jgi:hypothetical protein
VEVAVRTIKFRCWHIGKLPGVMLYDENPGDCLVWKNQGQEIDSIMQFTGLLDSKGKEIWEGDILEFDEYEWGGPTNRAEVKWDNGEFVAIGLRSDWGDCCEVIGDIYTTPELLKERK